MEFSGQDVVSINNVNKSESVESLVIRVIFKHHIVYTTPSLKGISLVIAQFKMDAMVLSKYIFSSFGSFKFIKLLYSSRWSPDEEVYSFFHPNF